MSEATPKRSHQARPPRVGYAATWASNLGHGLPNDLLDQALLRLTRLAAFMAMLMTVSITGHTVNNYISGVTRRCCTNRDWPARCPPTGSSLADAI